jgi:threonine/homoserine/homoserine lactone efflux protein
VLPCAAFSEGSLPLDVAGFALLATLLTIAPGQDTFLVLRNAAQGGFRAGVATTAGVCSGLFLHASLSALGLSALLATSTAVFSAVKWAGAAYLAWLGVQSLLRARRPRALAATAGASRARPAAVQGFLSNALNPKTATFYLALLPQFAVVPERVLADSLTLGGVHFVISFAWLALLSALVERSRRVLARPGLSRALDAVSGAAFLGFGLRLALAKR